MQVSDFVNQILPYARATVLTREVEFKQAVVNWLKAKNFLVGLAAPLITNILWNFVIGVGLSFITNIVVLVLLGTFSPFLLPLAPLIDEVLHLIEQNILNDIQKFELHQYMSLLVKDPATLGVVYKLSPGDATKVEHLSSYGSGNL